MNCRWKLLNFRSNHAIGSSRNYVTKSLKNNKAFPDHSKSMFLKFKIVFRSMSGGKIPKLFFSLYFWYRILNFLLLLIYFFFSPDFACSSDFFCKFLFFFLLFSFLDYELILPTKIHNIVQVTTIYTNIYNLSNISAWRDFNRRGSKVSALNVKESQRKLARHEVSGVWI